MNYEVVAVAESPREWTSSRGGTFLSYSVDLKDQDGSLSRGVEWTKKPESRAPQAGELVAGHIEPRADFPDRFKIDYEASKELPNQTRSQGSSEARTGSKGFENRDHSIARQVALKVLAPSINKEGALTDGIKAVTEVIETFILEAGQASSSAQGSPPEAGASPPASASPASSQASAEELQQREGELDLALDRLAVTDADERQWLTKAWRELPPRDEMSGDERRSICLGSLKSQDTQIQASALKRLREEAGPVPDNFRTNDIPF